MPKTLPHELDIVHFTVNEEREALAWAVPCISSSSPGISGNLFGYIIALENTVPKIAFVAKRRFRHVARELDLTTYKLAHEPKFLSENIVLYSLEKKPKYIFLFSRSQRAVVKAVVASIQERLAKPLEKAPSAELPVQSEETLPV